MPGNVQINTTGLSPDYCYTTPQQYAVDLAAVLYGTYSINAVINYGNATPAVSKQGLPWFRLNADGTPDAWYVYASGNWLSKHPQVPGEVIMYEGTEASIETFDGGEAGAITSTTGAFWEKVTQMDARFPIGPGTLPSGLVVNVGDQLGLEESPVPLLEHHHEIIGHKGGALSGGNQGAVLNPVIGEPDYSKLTEDTGTATATMSLIPPANAIFFIRRTARLYFRI